MKWDNALNIFKGQMMKNTSDYKSRFRILKGGKISLVVSALLASSVMVTSAHATGPTYSFESGGVGLYTQGANPENSAAVTKTSSQEITENTPVYLEFTDGNIGFFSFTNNGALSNSETLHYSEGIVIDSRLYNYSVLSQNLSITNTSTISTKADTLANGIAIYRPTGNYALFPTISNSGTITAEATAFGAEANGIYLSSNNASSGGLTITNTGTINVFSDVAASGIMSGSTAIGINAETTIYGNTITNNSAGVIKAYGLGDVYGIKIGTGSGSITNNGGIYAASSDNGGYSHSIYAVSANTGSITNSGTIEAILTTSELLNTAQSMPQDSVVNGVLDYSAYAIKSGGGLVTNTATGHINGNLDIGGSLTNAGTVSLPYNANGSGSATILGNFTNSGTLEIGLTTNGSLQDSGTQYSQLIVRGNDGATFNEGSKIFVNVLDSSTDVGSLAGSTLINVVSTVDSVISGFSNITVEDNSDLLNFEALLSQNDSSLDLRAVQAKTITDAVTNDHGDKNAQNISRTLDTLSTNSNMSSVIASLNGLHTDGEVHHAAQTLMPITMITSSGQTITQNISYAIVQRQKNITSLNSGDSMQLDDKALWVKTYGSLGKQNDKDGQSGFNVNSYGLGIGADGEYKKDQKIGLAMFYSRANMDVNNVDQKSDMDVISAIVYGSNLLADNATTFAYQLGYSWQNVSSDRHIFTGETASADYTSTTAFLDLKLSHQFDLGKAFSIEPNVGTTYRYSSNPSYSENGAGAANLIVDSFSTTELLGNFGTDITYKIDNKSSVVANLGAGYNFRDTTSNVSSAFEGASSVKFASQGIDNGRWRYEAGLGYDAQINEVSSINVSYDFQAQGADYTNNVLSAKYEYKF